VNPLVVATGFFFIMALILSGLIIFETRKIDEFNKIMERFMDANAEIFSVINVNAQAVSDLQNQVRIIDRVTDQHSMILDAHAHALDIYAPALTFPNPPVTQRIELT